MAFNISIQQREFLAGNIDANVKKIIEIIRDIRDGPTTVVVFPELCVPGYAALDLFLDHSFILQNRYALEKIAQECVGITAIVGFAEHGPSGQLYNSAAVLKNGDPMQIARKFHLPNYDVFYEKRYFESGRRLAWPSGSLVYNVEGKRVGIQICEDMWDDRHEAPVTQLQVAQGAEIIINMSASPYYLGKLEERITKIKEHAINNNVPFIYVNMVGSQDGYTGELAFDGSSMVVGPRGNIVKALYSCREDNVSIEERGLFDETIDITEDISERPEMDLFNVLSMSVKSYFDRCGFSNAIIGLSGGIDSAVVAAIAANALGADKIMGVTMPTQYSSKGSVKDSKALAHNLGIAYVELPIHDSYEAILDTLNPMWNATPKVTITEENIQARIRGLMLMAFSNNFGGLVLSTGNKTEMALGYCTLYGDTAGGLAVIGDVNKLMVYRLAKYINELNSREIIPLSTINKPPSAELSPEQTDAASFGASYDIVSPLVDDIIENNLSTRDLQRKYPNDLVAQCERLVRRAEYKRRQMAPAIKVTTKAFGIGRRFPISY